MENQNPLDKLFDVVSKEGLYTKSKNDFIQKYNNPQEIDKLYQVVSRDGLFTKTKDDFYAKYYPDLKKKEPEVSPYVSAPTKSPLQSPDFSQGQKMAEVGFTMPSAKREKEKIRVSPKLFGMPGEVDVEVVDDEATYRNTAQRFANDLLRGGAEIGAYVSEVMRDMGARQAKGIAKLTGNKEAKKISEQLGAPLYDKEGNLTEYAKNISWANDPTAKTILGLNGVKESAEQLQEQTKLPEGFIGGTIESLSSFTPDILFATLAPETKLAEGAGLIAKAGQTLINPFTKYLMVKEPLVAYGKAKRQGATAEEALKETPMGLVKGTATGAALALTGRLSEAATQGVMKGAAKYLLGSGSTPASKTILNKAAELGLTGKGGVATKELVNTLTDVVGYSLIYPTAASLVERGELPSEEEIMAGIGPAVAFRIKGAYENAKTFGELNRAVDQIQATKQGAAFVNFMEATPESILKVHNGKETADELQLQAIEAAKRAKSEIDPEEKQKAVIQASTLAKAANVKQMTDMVVSNKDGFQDFLNSDIPQPVKNAFIEKATAINKATNPTEQLKTSIGNRMKQSQDFVERMERDMQVEQDPVRKAEMQVQIDNANKVYKQQEAELKKLIFDQFQPRNFDANDIKAIKENQRLDNLEINAQINNLDRNDPDFAEKIESLSKRKEDQNDYYNELLKQNKEAEESGISVITPEEINQFDAIEISPEKEQTIEDFANRIAKGERMESPEDLQFYENNKGEIELALREKAKPAEIDLTTAKKMNASQNRYGIIKDGAEAGFIVATNPENNVVKIKGVTVNEELRGKNIAGDAYVKLGESLAKEGILLESDSFDKMEPSATRVWEKLSDKGLAVKGKNSYQFKPTQVKEEIKIEERPLDKDNQEYTTKTGRQKVTIEKGEAFVRDIKTGNEVSPATRKKALDEYIDSYNFSKGKTATENVPEAPEGLSSQELVRFGIENSENPLEVVMSYLQEEPISKAESSKEDLIAEFGIGKVNQKSFENFSDPNLVTGGMARTYFKKDGLSVDEVASEMSRYYGKQIDPQDIVDFMIKFPSGTSAAIREREGANALVAVDRFKELTGLDLTRKTAEKIVDTEFKKLAQDEQDIIKQDYENARQLEEEYWKQFEAERPSEEAPSAKAEPAKEGEKTLEDIYNELPKAEKLRKKEVDSLINNNFDSILKQLEKYKIC
jgi:hypothetical protein